MSRQIRTKDYRATFEYRTDPHANVLHVLELIIAVGARAEWSEELLKKTLQNLAATVIDGAHPYRDKDTRLSVSGEIILEFPGERRLMIDRSTIWQYVTEILGFLHNSLTLDDIARGEFLPNRNRQFPPLKDELVKSMERRLKKLHLVGDHVKTIEKIDDLDIKVTSFRVELTRQLSAGKEKSEVGISNITIDIIVYVDDIRAHDKYGWSEIISIRKQRFHNKVRNLINRITGHSSNVRVQHTIEQK